MASAIAAGLVPLTGNSATLRPPRSTATRRHRRITSSSLWLMNRIARPRCGQPGERGEQALGLLRRQHGRGLVQDQDAHVAIEGLEDLDPLPLADRQPAHHGIQRHVQPGVGDQALELAPGGTPVAPPAPQGLGAQHDVVEDREVGGQLEMLVHHADAGRQRRVWRARGQGAKLARGVGHQHPARRRRHSGRTGCSSASSCRRRSRRAAPGSRRGAARGRWRRWRAAGRSAW